jgi:hypothetical protein
MRDQAAKFFVAVRQSGWRVIVMAMGFYILLYPIYRSLDAAISHGIHRRGGTYTVDLRAMSDFELNQIDGKTQDIPKPFRDLDGKPVMLVGQMWSPNGAGGKVRNFDLVYSIGNCCFIGPPKVQHFVHASVPPGRNVEFSAAPVIVSGTLHVGVQKAGGAVQSIYRIDVDNVQPN